MDLNHALIIMIQSESSISQGTHSQSWMKDFNTLRKRHQLLHTGLRRLLYQYRQLLESISRDETGLCLIQLIEMLSQGFQLHVLVT